MDLNSTKDIAQRIGQTYKNIFVQLFSLLSFSEQEWENYKNNPISFTELSKKYLLPFGVIFLLVSIVHVFVMAKPNDSLMEAVIRISLLSVFFYFLIFILNVFLCLILFKVLWGVDTSFEQMSQYMVVPFLFAILGESLTFLWKDLFFTQYIAMACSILVLWKGVDVFFNDITGNKRTLMVLVGFLSLLSSFRLLSMLLP